MHFFIRTHHGPFCIYNVVVSKQGPIYNDYCTTGSVQNSDRGLKVPNCLKKASGKTLPRHAMPTLCVIFTCSTDHPITHTPPSSVALHY